MRAPVEHLDDREHDSSGREPRLAGDRRREDRRDDVRVRRGDAAENHGRRPETKRYDRRVSTPEPGWPLRRIVVLPLVLFVVVSAVSLHAREAAPREARATAPAPVTLGDAGARPGRSSSRRAAAATGSNAEGGVGPRLAGAQITVDAAKAQIDNGGGIMPARARHRRQRGRRPRLPDRRIFAKLARAAIRDGW